jgi:hypothetical protein
VPTVLAALVHIRGRLADPAVRLAGARVDHAARVRFVECGAEELLLCEVRELLREYRQFMEDVVAAGGFGSSETVSFWWVPALCGYIMIYGTVTTRSRPVKM